MSSKAKSNNLLNSCTKICQLQEGIKALQNSNKHIFSNDQLSLLCHFSNREFHPKALLVMDLCWCEHYYNATSGNPLFALEAFKISQKNNIPVKSDDWFMEYLFSFSCDTLDLEKRGITKRASEEVYSAFRQTEKRRARSVFEEYREIKTRTKIYNKVLSLVEKGQKVDGACLEVSSSFMLSAGRIKKIYYEERKIMHLGLSYFIENAYPRKV